MMFERKTARILYKKLLAFYPQAFRERFGESMEQTFDDLWNEKKRRAKQTSLVFLLWVFAETFACIVKERLSQFGSRTTMENVTSNHKPAAVIGFLLAMPLAMILFVEISGVEPLRGFFVALTTEPGSDPQLSIAGRIIILGALLLLPLGFVINLVPAARNMWTGHGFRTTPLNLLIAVALFVFIVTLVTGFVIDQYPCWRGVPNCD